MKFNPYKYQVHAKEHVLNNPFCGLFLEMGLGKTIITLCALYELMFEMFEVRKVLIIAPKRVAQTVWTDEIGKWDGLQNFSVSLVLGDEKKRKEALKRKAAIYITNRENVVWLCSLYGSAWPFDCVVIDELSSFKSSDAIRFRALKKIRPLIKRVIGLTGTPAPNNLLDLWPQLYLLDMGERLGKHVTDFRHNNFDHNPYQRKYTLKPGRDEKIHNAISDICISMKAEDYLQLPKRIDNDQFIYFSPALQKRYEKFEKEEILKIDDVLNIDVVNAAVLTNKLLQFTNGAIYDENRNIHELHTEKIEMLIEGIEAANGGPVLVFYSYKHDIPRLLKALKHFKPQLFEKPEQVKQWNAKQIPVLLAHPQSAGHGLNMQYGGFILFWFGLPWSSEYYLQGVTRVDRQGQIKRVLNNRLIVKNTIDEDVLKALNAKISGQDALMQAVKARIDKYL